MLQIGQELKREGVVRSQTVFVSLEKIASAERAVKAGDYLFNRPTSVFGVVVRLARGDFGIEQRKVFVREGDTAKDIAAKMRDFPKFNEQSFFEVAGGQEGRLFPDTYFLFVDITAQELTQKMRSNFDEKIETVSEKIKSSGKSPSDILIMASVIEKEVADPQDRAIVSGILWKRLDKGMLLQVDAAPETYRAVGLPAMPICNPGLDTIRAALNPQASPYYFYLTGKDGKTYFAKTFDEHKKNKAKYLK